MGNADQGNRAETLMNLPCHPADGLFFIGQAEPIGAGAHRQAHAWFLCGKVQFVEGAFTISNTDA